MCIIFSAVNDLQLEHNKAYYAVVEAFNNVGLRSRVFSDTIVIDETPPIGGLLIELSGNHQVNYSNSADQDGNQMKCSEDDEG